MAQFPSFLEDHVSQLPALHLLQNLGYVYLRPQEVFLERRGKPSNLLLEGILEKQLRQLNRITYKGQPHEFSDANIQAAIETLRDIPFDGLISTNEKIYDLIALGKSFEQTIGGDTRSFTLNYIDWKNPEKNVFHVVEEFEVERAGSHQTCRSDIVLFVNGIPFVVIECKRPDEKDSLNAAISNQLRNQDSEYIPRLFIYSQLLLAVNKNEAKYGTTGTRKEFWSHWKERTDVTDEVGRLINRPLAREQKDKFFADRYEYARQDFDELEIEEREVNEQDRAIYNLCRPERLIELAHQFIVFDAGEKKIARYQQYFAVKNTLMGIKHVGADGRRTGGVIWHTQGSGKSLTMVMMAKAIALEGSITDPRIVLVTDRIDLDDQIWGTFHNCGIEPVQAKTGRHLLDLLARNQEAIITTVIDKFETAVKAQGYQNLSHNIFVLVDESHRSQYGETNAKMQKLLPNACYIGFTGTPLKKRDKDTAAKFGGIIDSYPIDQAVKDKAVVPLLYEGRYILQGNDGKIYRTAWDISEHFSKNWQGTPFKAQLTADSKLSALNFKKYLDQFAHVSSEVLISGPEAREGDEAFARAGEEEIRAFWKQMMERYGSEKEYNRSLINAFKHGERPEIIIVVDKLLTGFDAPRNTVLYIARGLKEHTLLQAIARVNRLHKGKDFGYIIDYYGVLGEWNAALNIYTSLSEFDREDLIGTLADISEEAAKLPNRRAELWDIFQEIEGRQDEEAFEQLLADEARRERFYARLSAFNRTMSVAFSSVKFMNETPPESVERYKRDLADLQRLRVSVKRRYAEEIDFGEYEVRVQKLIKTHVDASAGLQIRPQVNIFDREKFRSEIDRLPSEAAKADTIAHRTKKTIIEKMEEDQVFYRRFSKSIDEMIQAWRDKRISDADYLNNAIEIMNSVRDRTGDDLPDELQNSDPAKAFYGVVNDALARWKDSLPNLEMIAVKAALKLDGIIRENIVVDWGSNQDVQNQMKNQIEDYLYAVKEMYGIDLRPDDMDIILDKCIEIAKTRYSQ
jgi:type I restriction enzyme, R subunit